MERRDREKNPTSPERVLYLKKLAAGTIRTCSRTRKPKDAVKTWINEHYPESPATSYLLGIPDTILEMIVEGVHEFAKL
jgi:hypothetical protein